MADIKKQVKIEFIGDDGKVKTTFDKMERDAEKTGISIGKKLAVGFAAIGAVGAKMVSSFTEADQIARKTEATIRATGGAAGLTAKQVSLIAKELQGVTKFGDDAIQSGQNLLLTFRNIKGDTFRQATEAMLDMSEAMGVDLKSSAIQLGKALNDPVQGISALSRTGVQFSEQQKAVIKSMAETGNIAGAQALILAELNNQFGGVARAASEGTGAYAQIGELLGDVLEIGGQVIHEFLYPAIDGFRDFLVEVIKTNEAERIFRNIGEAILVVIRPISLFINYFTTGLKVIWDLAQALPVVGSGFQAVNKVMTSSVGIWEGLKAAMIQGAAELMKAPLMLQDAWLATKQIGLESVKAVVDAFNTGISAIQEIGSKLPFVGDKFGSGGSASLTSASQGLGLMSGDIQAQRQGIASQISGINASASSAISAVATGETEPKAPTIGGVAMPSLGGGVIDETKALSDTQLQAVQSRKEEQAEEDKKAKADALAREVEHLQNLRNENQFAAEYILADWTGFFNDKNSKDAEAKKQALLGEREFASNVSEVMDYLASKNKKLAIAFAIVKTASGVARALSDYPFPVSVAVGASVAAAGAVQIAKIRGAAQGGIVGGFDTGRDNQLMAVRSGEMILTPDLVKPVTPTLRDIIRNEDERGINSGGSSQQVTLRFDPPEFGRFLREVNRQTAYAQGV